MSQPLHAFAVDDDASLRSSLVHLLETAGFRVTPFANAKTALAQLGTGLPDVILSDVRMPTMTGLEFLDALRTLDAPPLVLISAHGDIPTAVGAMQAGAYSFVEKPFDPRRLISILTHAGEQHRLAATTARLQNDLAALSGLDRVLRGEAPAIKALRDMVFDLAPARGSVLITGATGTGKELVARALHRLGPQRDGDFIAVNCATLSPDENAMFGPQGYAQAAIGGTLFLDDIAATPPAVQSQLLRLFGDPQARIVAASHDTPQGHIRDDLFFRLNTFVLNLPPLADRDEDVVILFNAFIAELSQTYEIAPPPLKSDDAAALLTHRWPGNVRELRHVAERRVLAARRGAGSVSEALQLGDGPDDIPDNLRSAVAGFERTLIAKAIQTHNGRMDAVAEALGIGRRTLNEKIVKLGLDKASLLAS